MKIFISMPMHGLKPEDIYARLEAAEKEIRDTVKVGEGETIDILHAPVEGYGTCGREVQNERLYNLSRSMTIMSECDTVYFCDGWFTSEACQFEHFAALEYGFNVMYEGIHKIFRKEQNNDRNF